MMGSSVAKTMKHIFLERYIYIYTCIWKKHQAGHTLDDHILGPLCILLQMGWVMICCVLNKRLVLRMCLRATWRSFGQWGSWNQARYQIPIFFMGCLFDSTRMEKHSRYKKGNPVTPTSSEFDIWARKNTLVDWWICWDFSQFSLGIMTGWWFGCHQFYFPIYWVANHPNWLSYFSEGWPNHQPDEDYSKEEFQNQNSQKDLLDFTEWFTRFIKIPKSKFQNLSHEDYSKEESQRPRNPRPEIQMLRGEPNEALKYPYHHLICFKWWYPYKNHETYTGYIPNVCTISSYEPLKYPYHLYRIYTKCVYIYI